MVRAGRIERRGLGYKLLPLQRVVTSTLGSGNSRSVVLSIFPAAFRGKAGRMTTFRGIL